MHREEVESSNIASIGWQSGVLEVEFHQGAVYQYYGVPYSVYTSFLRAESKGKFFAANIKGQGYPYERVTAPGPYDGRKHFVS